MSGGLGGSARDDELPPENVKPSYQMVQGIRDVRLIKRLLHRPDWKIPTNAEVTLPYDMYMIARNLRQGADGRAAPADYSPHMRMKATEVIQRMEDANRRKLSLSVRLSQLERRTNVVEEHPELMGGNVNNVVIILPEKASPGEFALPSERVIDAKPGGNGHGKA